MARQKNSLSHAPAECWLPVYWKYQRLRFGKQSRAGLGIPRIVRNAGNVECRRHRTLRRGQRCKRSNATRSTERPGQRPSAFVFIWVNNERYPAKVEIHEQFSGSKSVR